MTSIAPQTNAQVITLNANAMLQRKFHYSAIRVKFLTHTIRIWFNSLIK